LPVVPDTAPLPPSEAAEPGYGGLWARLDAELPRLLAVQEADRREAEALCRELLAVAAAARPAALESARFHRSLLADRLLERAQAALPADPAAAEELAALAGEVAGRLPEADESAAGRVRASCWMAHARRLGGDPAGAEQALSEATMHVLHAGEQALLCRALALLRWEQGRLDEAAALLERAAELWAGEEVPHEEGACWVLRALLAVDEGKARDAVGRLRTGLPLLADAWLTLYGGLALALGLAERGLDSKARAQRDESVRLMHASPPAAYLYALRLTGRIALCLGEHDEAEEQLEALRREALARRSLPEAVLATFDLARLDVERGRDREAAEARAADLEAAFGETEDLAALLAALRAYPLTAATQAIFLRTLRLRGVRSAPLPFT
jgi:tetratricopeptide (TPR) repeat protein